MLLVCGAPPERHVKMADVLGWRRKFGVIGPSTNTIVQPDFDAMRPLGVTNHTARSTIKERPLNSEQAFF